MVEYLKFFVRFSGNGGRMTLNEKDDCWEYLCPGKGKIVVWLDPDDEEERVRDHADRSRPQRAFRRDLRHDRQHGPDRRGQRLQ